MQQFTPEQTAQILKLISTPSSDQPNDVKDNKDKEKEDDQVTKDQIKKLQEERQREKEELEKSKSLIQTLKEALGFVKKEPPKKTNEDLLNDLNKDKKEDKDDKEKTANEKDKEKEDEKQKTIDSLKQVVNNLNDEVKSLKADKEKQDLNKDLIRKGLDDEDEQVLYKHLCDDHLRGKPKDYKIPEKQTILMISQAKAMAKSKKAAQEQTAREDIYDRLRNQGSNGEINRITVRDFNKMTIKEKERLNNVYPIVYNALYEQSNRDAGIREI